MKAILAVLAVIVLAGCVGGDAPSVDTARKASNSVRYSRDPRTKLCFASLSSATHGAFSVVSITHVPCTPEVEQLIGQ
jgi:hypothetical protein